MGIIRILRMLGILKCDISSKVRAIGIMRIVGIIGIFGIFNCYWLTHPGRLKKGNNIENTWNL